MSKADEERVAAELGSALGVMIKTPGLSMAGRECSDGACTLQSGWHLVLEVETSQTHPDTNVLKCWQWLEDQPNERVLLVQAYFSTSRQVNGSRGRLAAWLGKRVEQILPGRFLYRRIVDSDPETLSDIRELVSDLESAQRES